MEQKQDMVWDYTLIPWPDMYWLPVLTVKTSPWSINFTPFPLSNMFVLRPWKWIHYFYSARLRGHPSFSFSLSIYPSFFSPPTSIFIKDKKKKKTCSRDHQRQSGPTGTSVHPEFSSHVLSAGRVTLQYKKQQEMRCSHHLPRARPIITLASWKMCWKEREGECAWVSERENHKCLLSSPERIRKVISTGEKNITITQVFKFHHCQPPHFNHDPYFQTCN